MRNSGFISSQCMYIVSSYSWDSLHVRSSGTTRVKSKSNIILRILQYSLRYPMRICKRRFCRQNNFTMSDFSAYRLLLKALQTKWWAPVPKGVFCAIYHGTCWSPMDRCLGYAAVLFWIYFYTDVMWCICRSYTTGRSAWVGQAMCSRGQPNIGWRPLPYRVIALTLPHFLGNAAKKSIRPV